MEDALKDHTLWVGLPCKGMPFMQEMDLLMIIVDQVYNSGSELMNGDILSVQRLLVGDPMYILYCKSNEVKAKVLSLVTVQVRNQEYELTNFVNNKEGFGAKSKRVSIHGIPFSVDDVDIAAWVDTWASRSSNVIKAKAKPKDDPSHNLLNGNRFCYISSIITDLPRYSKYNIPDPTNPVLQVDLQITVYYEGQPLNCKRCFGDHDTNACSTRSNGPELEVFKGERNPMSNFFPVIIQWDDQLFPTSEHVFQYQKALSLEHFDIADRIIEAKTPYEAKKLGDSIYQDPSTDLTPWERVKEDVMYEILSLKYSTCAEFRSKLLGTKNKAIVEATNNRFWASGLTPSETVNTPKMNWPGENRLGQLLEELRETKRSHPADTSVQEHPTTDLIHVADVMIGHAVDPDSTLSTPEVIQRVDDALKTPLAVCRPLQDQSWPSWPSLSSPRGGAKTRGHASKPINSTSNTPGPRKSRQDKKRKNITPPGPEYRQIEKKSSRNPFRDYFLPPTKPSIES